MAPKHSRAACTAASDENESGTDSDSSGSDSQSSKSNASGHDSAGSASPANSRGTPSPLASPARSGQQQRYGSSSSPQQTAHAEYSPKRRSVRHGGSASQSASPQSHKSGSASPQSDAESGKERSRSPIARHQSRSSRSHSRSSGHSRSPSPEQDHDMRSVAESRRGPHSPTSDYGKEENEDVKRGGSQSETGKQRGGRSRSGSSGTPSVEGSKSPASKRSESQSPTSRKSASKSPRSRSESKSPVSRKSGSRSPASPSGSKSPGSRKSVSRSPGSRKSLSRSPGSRKNVSRSPGSRKSVSRSPGSMKSLSRSPGSRKSASRSPGSKKSASRSPGSRKSASRSPGSRKSASRSPGFRKSVSRSPGSRKSVSRSPGSRKSVSKSPQSMKSASRSPGSRKSVSRSPGSRKSPSRSPQSIKSASRSPASKKSVSPGSRKSGSKSPGSGKSGSKSPRSRSGSQSPVARQSRSRSPLSGRGTSKSPPREDEAGTSLASKQKSPITRSPTHKSGSDDEGANKERRDSESDQDNLVIDAEALFGDASDISSEDEGRQKKALKISDDEGDEEGVNAEHEGRRDSDVGSDKGRSGDEADKDREEDKEVVPEEPIQETRIDVEIPRIATDAGKELHFVKLPNFLSVETRPYDPDTYEDEIDEEETLDEEGRARLKLKVENTIRWREVTGKQGETLKESNGRFVRWSDGSMSLHLGSEIFDVYKQPLQGDHNHLFIRQGTGLQGQAVFRTKLTFRPHSTESFTHRKMTMSLADRSQKTSGIKVLSLVGKDPEAHRGELIKKEEERLRASMRRESKQRRVREKGASRGLSAGYLEPDRYGDGDSDDEGISISAIKKQHKNKVAAQKAANIYSSDEEGSDIETRRARRLDKAKALKDSDSEDGSMDADQKSEAEGSASGDDE